MWHFLFGVTWLITVFSAIKIDSRYFPASIHQPPSPLHNVQQVCTDTGRYANSHVFFLIRYVICKQYLLVLLHHGHFFSKFWDSEKWRSVLFMVLSRGRFDNQLRKLPRITSHYTSCRMCRWCGIPWRVMTLKEEVFALYSKKKEEVFAWYSKRVIEQKSIF